MNFVKVAFCYYNVDAYLIAKLYVGSILKKF